LKKDILELKVEDLAIAVVPDNDDEQSDYWQVYILNLKDEAIENVLVASRGYGEINGEKKQTSTLRHFFPMLTPLDLQKVEPIQRELFELSHEYWVSFSHNGHLYDKKYVFVVGSLDAANFTPIPFLGKRGVMIR
jgi:hypothetical protein